MISKIKEILFKIKDYDRLEHDYSCCLWYFTKGRLSKTNYEIRRLETVICDTIGEYMDEGEQHAKDEIISLIESRIGEILGDAQPAPVLRAELRELINKLK